MANRREFLKSTLIIASGVAIAKSTTAAASMGGYPAGVIYTSDNAGQWKKKVGGHAPKVSKQDSTLTIATKHSMSEKHYIVRHTLVAADGKVLGAKTFYPEDEDPISTHQLPAGYKGKLYVTSFCNKHDFWMSEITV